MLAGGRLVRLLVGPHLAVAGLQLLELPQLRGFELLGRLGTRARRRPRPRDPRPRAPPRRSPAVRAHPARAHPARAHPARAHQARASGRTPEGRPGSADRARSDRHPRRPRRRLPSRLHRESTPTCRRRRSAAPRAPGLDPAGWAPCVRTPDPRTRRRACARVRPCCDCGRSHPRCCAAPRCVRERRSTRDLRSGWTAPGRRRPSWTWRRSRRSVPASPGNRRTRCSGRRRPRARAERATPPGPVGPRGPTGSRASGWRRRLSTRLGILFNEFDEYTQLRHRPRRHEHEEKRRPAVVSSRLRCRHAPSHWSQPRPSSPLRRRGGHRPGRLRRRGPRFSPGRGPARARAGRSCGGR